MTASDDVTVASTWCSRGRQRMDGWMSPSLSNVVISGTVVTLPSPPQSEESLPFAVSKDDCVGDDDDDEYEGGI